MLAQLKYARDNNIDVNKVVLVGGFGDSPALKRYLNASLSSVSNQYGTKVQLRASPQNRSATGVAVGAFKRALNKSNGPRRVPYRSIGILYHVPVDPVYGSSSEVLAQRATPSDLSNEDYIMRTIKWIIKVSPRERVLKPFHRFSFESMHVFSANAEVWVAKEVLYASDTCTEDYFTRSHIKNRGKTTEFGHVEFDVTHLKTRIQMFVPPDTDHGEERYEATLRIEMTVIDRHLEFTAYWPTNDKEAIAIQGSQASFDVSSAFKPGTALASSILRHAFWGSIRRLEIPRGH